MQENFSPPGAPQKLSESSWKKARKISEKLAFDVKTRNWVGSKDDREWVKSITKRHFEIEFPRFDVQLEETSSETTRVKFGKEHVDLVILPGNEPVLVPMGVLE
jgi:hypothetical protein